MSCTLHAWQHEMSEVSVGQLYLYFVIDQKSHILSHQ